MGNLKGELKKWKNKQPKKKREEELSVRDIEELMGKHRPTYKRHKGAYRQN
jgi:hypothetical protein